MYFSVVFICRTKQATVRAFIDQLNHLINFTGETIMILPQSWDWNCFRIKM